MKNKQKKNGKQNFSRQEEQFLFQKDMELELLIEDMGTAGEGIGKKDGVAFFVKDAVLGDLVLAKVMKMKKNYGYARLIQVLKHSPFRTEPRCPYYRQCGGCQIQALDYRKQLEFKENKVKNNLKRIGGFRMAEDLFQENKPENNLRRTEDSRRKEGFSQKNNREQFDGLRMEAGFSQEAKRKKEDAVSVEEQDIPVLHPIIGMEEPYHYRNKAQFPIGTDKNGNIVTGFYAARSHTIIPNRKCYLGAEINEKILNIVISFMEENGILPYQEAAGIGLVRHVLIRCGFVTGEIMVCLVLNGRELPFAGKLVDKLRNLSGMTSITLNVNEKDTNVILGDEIITLWGQNYITDYIGNVKYQISPLSFYQVNPIQTRRLYETALEYAGLTGTETVWDLYCGIGTISLFLAQKAKQVYGVEVVEPAIWDARNNARINGIENVEFFVGKAEEVLPEFYEKGFSETRGGKPEGMIALESGKEYGMRHPDVIVVDPPRKGCDEKCLEIIVKMQPERVVYVSCDPATLARDLKYLCGRGYEVREVQPVDMFPQGVHVETVVMLSHKKPDSVINVKVEFGEGEAKVPLDNIVKRAEAYKPKERVTYKMIKEYIEAKYGFKVHTAYIAELKRELGLPMYDAPNAVEELKQPRKHPTKEKVEAIKDALKNFSLI